MLLRTQARISFLGIFFKYKAWALKASIWTFIFPKNMCTKLLRTTVRMQKKLSTRECIFMKKHKPEIPPSPVALGEIPEGRIFSQKFNLKIDLEYELKIKLQINCYWIFNQCNNVSQAAFGDVPSFRSLKRRWAYFSVSRSIRIHVSMSISISI